jgi:hypothetical protein
MPSSLSSGSIDFFRGALPEAMFWGRIALGVGIAGLVVSLLFVLAHLRDRLSLHRGHGNPGQYLPPKWGPLDRCLGEFFADPLHSAPLSPDAASEFITSRLDAEHDVTHSVVRYFSYAPLLLGLMGTTFALRTLLVTSGDTLQEIQPQLSGVFAGTLAGIAGSLLAAVGGLVLDRVALSTANRAQDFIHRFIIPTLPERRIAIRIEDAVLAVISERAQAVVESFRTAMQPVVTELEAVADRCGKAAATATDAFSEAARAVREAGNLEVASRNFKTGAHMIDSAAEQLSDATKQTAEVLLRAGEVRGSLKALLERIQASSETLGASSERVGNQLDTQLAALNQQISRLENAAVGLRAATETLSTELIRRAHADSAHMEATKTLVDTVAHQLVDLRDLARESFDDVKSLHASVDTIDKKTENIGAQLSPQIDESSRRAENAVNVLQAGLDRRFLEVSTTLEELKKRSDGNDGNASRDLQVTVREAVGEMRKASQDARVLMEEVRRQRPTRPPDTPKGFLRWPWK